MIQKLLIGSFISFALAFVVSSAAYFYFKTLKNPSEPQVETDYLNSGTAKAFAVAKKVEKKRQVSKSDKIGRWQLLATVTGGSSYAMLHRGSESKILKPEDGLEGYKLAKIEKTRALFKAGNEDMWLYMSKYAPKGKKDGDKKQKAGSDPNSYALNKSRFERIMSKPEMLLEDIQVGPHFRGNDFAGFKVNHLRTSSFLDVYGMEEGDVITHINGKRIVSVADALSQYQDVMGQSNFTITVQRDDQEEVLRYDIK